MLLAWEMGEEGCTYLYRIIIFKHDINQSINLIFKDLLVNITCYNACIPIIDLLFQRINAPYYIGIPSVPPESNK